jgi:hypothetical protein
VNFGVLDSIEVPLEEGGSKALAALEVAVVCSSWPTGSSAMKSVEGYSKAQPYNMR